MILYIYGSDSFRSRQYLKQSVDQFKKTRDPQGYNVVFVEGKKDEAGKILSELSAAPFLVEKRMVVVENILSSNDKELLSALIGKKLKFPESTVAVFWQAEPLSKIKEAKELEALLKKEKYAREFEILFGAQLASWVIGEIKERGGKIDQDALNYLCQNIGNDMWRVNSLIDQLVAYVGDPHPNLLPPGEGGDANPSPHGRGKGEGRSITLADVQLFLDEKIDDNIFNLVDAIAQGNYKQAYKLLYEQRRLGEEDGKIFGLLIWQFRILLEMADVLERENNLTSEAIAKTIGIHPFVAKKNLAIVKRTPIAKLQNIYGCLLDIDIKTKTGVAPQDLLIDLFVGKI